LSKVHGLFLNLVYSGRIIMSRPDTHLASAEIKLFYQIFAEDVIDDSVSKNLWGRRRKAQFKKNQLYFKVFREDEDAIPVGAIEFDNVRMLLDPGLLGLEEPLQNALSRSANWFGSFIPESIKQTAYGFGNSLAEWAEDKLTGLSAYSSIPKVQAISKEDWERILEENPEVTDEASPTTSASYLDLAWDALAYAANNPIKTLIVALAASSVANRVHLPKVDFDNFSSSLPDLTNGMSTAANIAARLTVAKMATNGHTSTPLNAMIAGMSLWNPVAATTSEFQVNTYTTLDQIESPVASFSDGSFVVTWQSNGQDGSNYGVYGQRLNATGAKIGPEFLANTYITNEQGLPTVASFLDNSFVMAWKSSGQDGSGEGVYGQRFNATGAKIGAEFQVNTYTTSDQTDPAVATFSDGSFVLTWWSLGQDGSNAGVYEQRFDAANTKMGGDVQVNTYTTSDQRYPAVARFSDNSYVVIWSSNGQDGSGWGVYGQRFNAAGTKVGSEFQVNTYTAGDQLTPYVCNFLASFVDDRFLVTWMSNGQDGAGWGIYGQLFNATGVKIGSEFRVNAYTTSDQQRPSVATFVDGGFVVTWQSNSQDGSGWGVYGQRFNTAGTKVGSEFQVNIFTATDQQYSYVASFADGSFVVTWQGNSQDGSSYGIFGRIFTPPRLHNNTLTLNQGESRVLTSSEFSASALNTLPSALVFTVSNVTNGRFEFVNNPGIAIFNFTQQQVNDGQVQFVHDGSAFPPSYSIAVKEVVLDTTPAPATVVFNKKPVITLGAGSTTFTEKGAAAVLASGLNVTDDNAMLSNATVTITGNFVSGEDVLNFADQSGITGVYDNVTGVLSLTGSATVANYQAALRNVTYSNTSNNPSPLSRTISFRVNDGVLNSDVATQIVNITPVNDAPVLVGSGGSISYTEKDSAIVIDPAITLADVDGAIITNATVAITGNFAGPEDVLGFVNQLGITGSYDSGTGVLTLTGSSSLANYQTALRSITYRDTSDNPSLSPRTISFTAGDGLSSNPVTRTINITPVNDAPVLVGSGGSVGYTEKGSAIVVDSGITLTNVDGSTITNATVAITGNFAGPEDVLYFVDQLGITGSYDSATGVLTLTGASSLANYQTALRSITYRDTSDNPSLSPRTISFTVDDGLNSNTVTRTVNIAPVNDASVLVGSGGSISYTEKGSAIAVDSGITLTDVDGFTITNATVVITGNFAGPEDVLDFVNQLGITGSYNNATGVLTLSGASSLANYQTALRSITYRDTSDNPSLAPRTISFTINDGELNSNTATRTVNITPVNDPSVLAGTGGTLNYIEKTTRVIDPNIVISDVDGPSNLVNATIKFIGSVLPEDVLSFTPQAGITGTYNNATGILTLTGSASALDYQLALRSVTYYDASSNPSTAPRTVSFTVSDGESYSNTVNRTIAVTPVNDPPVLTVNALTIAVGQSKNLTAAELSVNDPDTLGSALTFTISAIQFCRFERTSAPGVAITTFTWQELIANQIRIVATGGTVSAPAYQVSVSDGEYSTTPASASVTFNGGFVPIITANQLTIPQGGTVILTNSNLNVIDTDTAPPSLTFTVSNVRYGKFSIVGNPTPTTTFTLQSINNGFVQFTHDGSENEPSYDIAVSDGVYTTSTQAAIINYINVNQAPAPINLIPGVTGVVGNKFSFQVPTNTFLDPDPGDQAALRYLSTLQDGGALPSWVSFDPSTRQFTGTFTVAGQTFVSVFAIDPSDTKGNTTFTVTATVNNIISPSTPGTTPPDDTIGRAITGGAVSAAIAFFAFFIKYMIKRASNKKVELALATKQENSEKQAYQNEVIKPIADYIRLNFNISGTFKSISRATVRDFIRAVEALVGAMMVSGINYQTLSQPECTVVHTTILKELRNIMGKIRCAPLWRMFNAEITPRQIEDNAEQIAKAVAAALNQGQANSAARASSSQRQVMESLELQPTRPSTSANSRQPRETHIKLAEAKVEAAEAKARAAQLEAQMAAMQTQVAQLVRAQSGPIHTSPRAPSLEAMPQQPVAAEALTQQLPARPSRPLSASVEAQPRLPARPSRPLSTAAEAAPQQPVRPARPPARPLPAL
jgi:hypothetical protein